MKDKIPTLRDIRADTGQDSDDIVYSFSNGRQNKNLLVIGDLVYVRDDIIEDARQAGFDCQRQMDLAEAATLIQQGDTSSFIASDLTIVDCPGATGPALEILAYLNHCVAKGMTSLIVSTSIGSLDDVFYCVDQRAAQILVTPTRGDRIIALGQVLAETSNRVRDISNEDRLALLQLTEQVGQIAKKLDALAFTPETAVGQPSAFKFEQISVGERSSETNDRQRRNSQPPLPDPRLVRKIMRQREQRARFFEGNLFADPAWDILLDLTAASEEHRRVSVSSLCIAAGVPTTTALRWIGHMTDAGLINRVDDDIDRRRSFLSLSDGARLAMSRYFATLGQFAGSLI